MHRPLLLRSFPALGLDYEPPPVTAPSVRVAGTPSELAAPADTASRPGGMALPSSVNLLALGILAIPLAAGGYLIYQGSVALGVGVIILGPAALMIAVAAGIIALGGL